MHLNALIVWSSVNQKIYLFHHVKHVCVYLVLSIQDGFRLDLDNSSFYILKCMTMTAAFIYTKVDKKNKLN